MKYQEMVDELDKLLDSAEHERARHQEKLACFFAQFQSEEKKLRKKIKKENSKTNRKKLKKELGVVQKAYAILGYT